MSEMKKELENVLLTWDRPSEYFEKLRSNNSLDAYFSELKALIGVLQNREHHLEGDAWTHTMLVLDEAAKRRDKVNHPFGFMLSALCHDLGKAVCTTISEDGSVHSYRHEEEGLPIVEKMLKRLDIDSRTIAYVLNMTELHMEPNIMANVRSRLKKTNRLFDKADEPFDLIQLSICDGLGKIPQCTGNEEFLIERYDRFREIMARPYVTEKDLSGAGLNDESKLPEIMEYAHKLRLAGLDKADQLRQSLAYARAVLKIKTEE